MSNIDVEPDRTEQRETTAEREQSALAEEAGGPAERSDSSRFLTRGRAVNALGLLVLLALVAPFLVYAVPGVVGANASFVVLSGSMEPLISAGDVVIVGETDPATIAAGDVITFARDSSDVAVTHRVIDIDSSGTEPVFYTKGDANENVDVNPVPAAAIIGTVVLTIPYIGYVIQFVGTTIGFVLLVVLPVGLLLVTEVVAVLRRRLRSSDPADRSEQASSTSATSGDPAQFSESDSPDTEIAFTSADLLLTLGVLVVTVPYAGYVAMELRTPLSIAVAVGLGTALLLIGAVFLLARYGSGNQSSAGLNELPDPSAEEPGPITSEPTPDGGSNQVVKD